MKAGRGDKGWRKDRPVALTGEECYWAAHCLSGVSLTHPGAIAIVQSAIRKLEEAEKYEVPDEETEEGP